jgi:hypothetical protein
MTKAKVNTKEEFDSKTRIDNSGKVRHEVWSLREQACRRDVIDSLPSASKEELVRWKRHIERNIYQNSNISAELIRLISEEIERRER